MEYSKTTFYELRSKPYYTFVVGAKTCMARAVCSKAVGQTNLTAAEF